MKKLIALALCLLLAVLLAGCGSKETGNGSPVSGGADMPDNCQAADTGKNGPAASEALSASDGNNGQNTVEINNIEAKGIDAISIDIDNDGVYENCSMAYGPTSGLFTVVITASVNGTVKYKNTVNIAWGEVSFGEIDGIGQFVRNGEYHRLYVEDNRIVIDNLDPQKEGYWGDSNWNYNLK